MTVTNHLQIARSLASLLDSKFSLFGFRFGIDPLFAFIPGVGTMIPTLLSLYLLWIGYQMQLPSTSKTRMIFNIVIDAFLGSLPVLGIVSDAIFKANEKNLSILEEHEADSTKDQTPTARIVT